MSTFKFKGDLNSLSTKQQEFLTEILVDKGFKDNVVELEAVGKAGDNYNGNVKRITVHKNNGENFKLIAKTAPPHEVTRALMHTGLLYTNEINMYKEVIPRFIEIQKAANIPECDYLRFPECYGILKESPNEMILLEDLHISNFEMLDKFQSLTDESVKIILKKFATFHSLSFVLRKRDPDVFQSFSIILSDYIAAMSNIADFQDYLTGLEKDTLAILKDEKYRKAIGDSITQMAMRSEKAFRRQINSKYSVIVQGDAWTNNLMFKLKGDIAVDAIMIDYQLSRVGSPAADILYMILSCTDHNLRSARFYDWIDHYYSELDKSLSNYDLKADDIYPRTQLDDDIISHSMIYFGTSILINSVLIRSTEEAAKIRSAMENPDVSKSREFNISQCDNASIELFRKRVKGLIDTFREFGFID